MEGMRAVDASAEEGGAERPRVSVVVPALNEERYLPRLLDALDRQSFEAREVIVADAGSADGTADLARERGCTVVSGGRPARGRNAGASRAGGKFILFLDADVTVPPTFVQDLMGQVREKGLAVASGFISPDSGRLIDRVLVGGSNLFCYLVQRTSPHAAGFYIFVRKSLHEEIGGFNEELFVGEDHDYVNRASKMGKFRFLTHPRVAFSMRRFDREGRTLMLWKLFVLEIYRSLKKEVKREVVTYEFGKH